MLTLAHIQATGPATPRIIVLAMLQVSGVPRVYAPYDLGAYVHHASRLLGGVLFLQHL